MRTNRDESAATIIGRSENDDIRDRQFLQMLRAFKRSGGIARDAEIFANAACRCPQWSRKGVAEEIIRFEWGSKFWLPWFQFDRADMSLRQGPAKVIAELIPVFDSWELAAWFSEPNLWIGKAKPIDLIDDSLADVLGAARADRFIAAG